MGDLDPAKVKAAITSGLAILEPLVIQAKNEQVAEAWNALLRVVTPKLLRGEITVDEWKTGLGQFGAVFVRASPASGQAISDSVNRAAQIVEEAFNPPSNLTWLLFAGAGVMGLAYWWMKKQESEREEVRILSPGATLLGSKRKKASLPIADPEEEEAEFEEIT